jgi:hypothetical protein
MQQFTCFSWTIMLICFLFWYSTYAPIFYFMFCLLIYSFSKGNIRSSLLIGSGNIKECKNLFLHDILVQMSDRTVNILLLSSNRPNLFRV